MSSLEVLVISSIVAIGMLKALITLILVGAAYVLIPYDLTLNHIITLKVFSIGCSPSEPKLTLVPVKSCSEVDVFKEPCVIRNAVPDENIDAFLTENGEEEFVVKVFSNPEFIGNPLMEPSSLLTRDKETVKCTINEFINDKEVCKNAYTGFKSLNYSNYIALNTTAYNMEDFSRTDIFIGYPTETKVTASFHSNNFEKSTTIQITGEKIWLMMKPESYYTVFKAYALGAYNAAFNVCVNDLEKVELQTIHVFPGDLLSFPKAWPHHIYSIAGPNIMINFRQFYWHAWKLRDVLSMFGLISSRIRQPSSIDASKCNPATTALSSYGVGHPKFHFSQKVTINEDMRCTDLFEPSISRYKKIAREVSTQNAEIDRGIYNQVAAYHGLAPHSSTPSIQSA